MEKPAPPPESVLIRTARKAAGLSIEAAAEKAGVLSFVRWSQVENGYESRGGKFHPVRGTDTHVGHMAQTVGVSPERLEQAGRPDAAAVLREIILQAELATERERAAKAAAFVPRRRFANAALQDMWDRYESEMDHDVLENMLKVGEMLLQARLRAEQRSA